MSWVYPVLQPVEGCVELREVGEGQRRHAPPEQLQPVYRRVGGQTLRGRADG